MWDLSQNDGSTANVLMHIIIYSIVYEKKEKKKRICIHIGSIGLYIYFGIRATVKLLEKKGCYNFHVFVLRVFLILLSCLFFSFELSSILCHHKT